MPRTPERNGVAQIWEAIRALQAENQKRRGLANFLENATVGRGGMKFVDGGSVVFQDGGGVYLGKDGRFLVEGDDTYVQILDDEFSIGTIGPDGELTWPASSFRPDGFLAAKSATEYVVVRIDEATGDAVLTSSTGRVHLPYQSTGDSANMRILYDGTVLMVASSERYKTDIAPIEVDIDDVLFYTGITWVHTETLDSAPPGPIRRSVGHHAEAMDERPSLRQFVNYKDGQPDSVEDPRWALAVHELAKHTHGRVVELEQTVAAQADQLAEQSALIRELADRVASLESSS